MTLRWPAKAEEVSERCLHPYGRVLCVNARAVQGWLPALPAAWPAVLLLPFFCGSAIVSSPVRASTLRFGAIGAGVFGPIHLERVHTHAF